MPDDLNLLEAYARRIARGEGVHQEHLLALLGRIEVHGPWPKYLLRILDRSARALSGDDSRKQFFHAARALIALRRYAAAA